MRLRAYQDECLARIAEAFSTDRCILVEMPTGTGKTVVFAHLADRWEGRVLIPAHRDELIQQAAEKVGLVGREAAGVYLGKEDFGGRLSNWPKCVVSSVQTMCRPARQQLFPHNYFTLIIVDEAHHAVARSYLSVLDHFYEAKILGVTATPKRTDDRALGQVFTSVAYTYSILDAIEDGWLVPVQQQCVQVDGLDFSQVREIAGDFHEGELEAILTQETPLHKMARPIAEEAGDRPTLIFCCSVKHAEMLCQVIQRYRPGRAAWLSGHSPMQERRDTVQRFRTGELQFLLSCSLFLEGFDAPQTGVVVMGRPTKSLALFTQVLGRGTRPLPALVDGLETSAERRLAIRQSKKPFMLALDFAGNAGRHKIVSAVDVLGGKFTPAARVYARRLLEEAKQARPLEEVLKEANLEMAYQAEVSERRRRIKASVDYHLNTVNPFDTRQAAAAPATQYQGQAEPATERQIWKLGKLGVSQERASRFTKRQASAVIGKLLREQEGS